MCEEREEKAYIAMSNGYGDQYSTKFDRDCDMEEVVQKLKQALLAMGFHPETVNSRIKE